MKKILIACLFAVIPSVSFAEVATPDLTDPELLKCENTAKIYQTCGAGGSPEVKANIVRSINVAAKKAGTKLKGLSVTFSDLSRPYRWICKQAYPVIFESNGFEPKLTVDTSKFSTGDCPIERLVKVDLMTVNGYRITSEFPINLTGKFLRTNAPAGMPIPSAPVVSQ